MFVILVYDCAQKKDRKALKICRKYLIHIQNSVFEGELSYKALTRLKNELYNVLDAEKDSLIIYEFENNRNVSKTEYGIRAQDFSFI